MIKLRALHIASFDGNIGDNANHNGFYRLLQKHHSLHLFELHQWEIREFFWGHKLFDTEFVELANTFDLLIIGGGNFFELWVEKSCNSTSIDISIELLEQINTPILFNALGVDPHQGVAKKEAFREWINYITSNPKKYLLSVRNDGAIGNLISTFDQKFAKLFHPVPDGGFFMEIDSGVELPKSSKYIGINIAGDMLEGRFSGTISPSIFIERFASLMQSVSHTNKDLEFVFFPHIYRDLQLINRLFESLPDWYIRKKVHIAPYLHGQGSEKVFFKYYRQCELIWANRFHSNVCSINLGVPVVGLLNYPQIENLYKEIDATEMVIDVRKDGFDALLEQRTLELLENGSATKEKLKKIKADLDQEAFSFHQKVSQWLPGA